MKSRQKQIYEQAKEKLDEWNNVTGFVVENTSYYFEVKSLMENMAEWADKNPIEIISGSVCYGCRYRDDVIRTQKKYWQWLGKRWKMAAKHLKMGLECISQDSLKIDFSYLDKH